MRAVLDANVVISGLIRPSGPPGQILIRLLRDKAFELVASPGILTELRRSLRYPKLKKYLHFGGSEVDLWVDALASLAVIVEGKVTQRVVPEDPADDVYIAAAVEGLAQYIVSGDHHLLDLREHTGVRIITPRAFLERVRP